MGDRTLKVHDFQANLDFANCKGIAALRARIGQFYRLVFLGTVDLEQPSYEQYGGRVREQAGTDTQVLTHYGSFRVQEKIRRPQYWMKRQKDVYVELKNKARGGPGWFYRYRNAVDCLGYYFVKDWDFSEIHFVLYNQQFFELVDELMRHDAVYYPKAHKQQFPNGRTGGETSGCIVQQRDLRPCRIARFEFRQGQFERLYLKRNEHGPTHS